MSRHRSKAWKSSPSDPNPDPDEAAVHHPAPSFRPEQAEEEQGEEPVAAIALEWAPAFTQRLVRDLAPIRDARIRALALGERLASLTASDIVVVARRLHDMTLDGDEVVLDILSCFQNAEAIEKHLGRDHMLDVAYEARRIGEWIVSELIRPREGPSGGTRTHRLLRDITLGQRKSMARGADPDILSQLLEDDHPDVQANLLSNPRLTAREVVRAAAKHEALPHALRGIARHHRWMHHIEVRRALAKNPETPLDVSGRILANLPMTDLQEVVEDARIHPTLRELARQRLERAEAKAQRISDEDATLTEEELAELGIEFPTSSDEDTD